MAQKNNMLVRDCARINNVKMWELADLLGISNSTLMIHMRKEWSLDKQKEVVAIIENYARGTHDERTDQISI